MSRKRVLRGGSWDFDRFNARAAGRDTPSLRRSHQGFRCAQDFR